MYKTPHYLYVCMPIGSIESWLASEERWWHWNIIQVGLVNIR